MTFSVFMVLVGIFWFILSIYLGAFAFILGLGPFVFGVMNIKAILDYEEQLREISSQVDKSFELIKRNLKEDNFSFNSAIDLELKMLDRVLLNRFRLQMDLNGDVLTIVALRDNSPESYLALGISKAPYYRILLNKIRYYVQEGEIISKTRGGGGGSSFSLINGWHGKIDPVHISTEIEDRKHTRLFFEDESGKDVMLTFSFDDFHKFKKLIPRKDYEIVQKTYSTHEVEVKQVNTGGVNVKLQELKELRNQDLITDSEYELKRNKLIDSI